VRVGGQAARFEPQVVVQQRATAGLVRVWPAFIAAFRCRRHRLCVDHAGNLELQDFGNLLGRLAWAVALSTSAYAIRASAVFLTASAA
jgi:hypothetical protein